METKKTFRTAVGYLRVSSTSQEDGTSLEHQKENIKNFCRSKDIILVDIFVDVYSAKDLKRPNFEKAFKFLKEKGFDVKLVEAKDAPHIDLDMTSESKDAIEELVGE